MTSSLRITPTQRVSSVLSAPLALMTIAALATGLLATSHAMAQGAPQTDDEKAFYSMGASLAGQLEIAKPISERELDLVMQGIRDSVGDKTLAVEAKDGAALVRPMLKQRQERAVGIEKSAANAFLEAEGAKKGAKKTESGLVYTEVKAGRGPSPVATDKVRVHYHGTLRDGSVFDSSVERGEPAEFPLNRVIPCWTEGVAMMKVGGKSRLVCPADIAYGNRGTGRIKAGAALAFDVELLEIVK